MAHAAPDSSSSPTTAAFTKAIRAGDAAAFTQLYETHFDRLLTTARRCTRRDEQFCLDIVQEVFVKVINRLPILENERALHAWLERTTATTAYDALRREIRRTKREQDCAEDGAARRATSELESQEQLDWLARELASMNEQSTQLIMARHRAGKTMPDLTNGSARGRIHRTMQLLRKRARRAFSESGGPGVL